MRDYQYDYTIYPENSPKKFQDICAKIEQDYYGFKKESLLIDVDGSTIQVYSMGKQEIVVYDDYDIGAVFVKSDIDLSETVNGLATVA